MIPKTATITTSSFFQSWNCNMTTILLARDTENNPTLQVFPAITESTYMMGLIIQRFTLLAWL
jgi:hypothetical protein